ncbi:MAG: hypothetical protein JNK84_04865 [Phreatobacter sp.]|uniref:hypothetical protein n=1 Tax=Phreatobacter sp. TaxID=1966341 RepID=UPI001A61B6EB|nr:hypothetical protein [Phreatobacter sp.]MBL8568397.1 hypothetical protein [Phreatobacter sp.]
MGNHPQGQKPDMDKDRDQQNKQHQQGGGAPQQQGGKHEPGRGGDKDQMRPDHDRDKQRR